MFPAISINKRFDINPGKEQVSFFKQLASIVLQ